MGLAMKHLLSLEKLSAGEIHEILDKATMNKREGGLPGILLPCKGNTPYVNRGLGLELGSPSAALAGLRNDWDDRVPRASALG